MYEDAMEEDLKRIRLVFEWLDKSDMPVSFYDFPLGACGDTCQVLAEILAELGHGEFRYIEGEREDGKGHAWLEQGGMLIDITADQFDEVSEPVYLGPLNSWYQQFWVKNEHTAGFRELDAKAAAELSVVYSKVRAELNT
jgi:hypothetical protein